MAAAPPPAAARTSALAGSQGQSRRRYARLLGGGYSAAGRCLDEGLCGIRCNDPVGVASRLATQWADAVITNKEPGLSTWILRLRSCQRQSAAMMIAINSAGHFVDWPLVKQASYIWAGQLFGQPTRSHSQISVYSAIASCEQQC